MYDTLADVRPYSSGLDSVSAGKVIRVLQDLARGDGTQRTTVIATIHQPSSQIFVCARISMSLAILDD